MLVMDWPTAIGLALGILSTADLAYKYGSAFLKKSKSAEFCLKKAEFSLKKLTHSIQRIIKKPSRDGMPFAIGGIPPFKKIFS